MCESERPVDAQCETLSLPPLFLLSELSRTDGALLEEKDAQMQTVRSQSEDLNRRFSTCLSVFIRRLSFLRCPQTL